MIYFHLYTLNVLCRVFVSRSGILGRLLLKEDLVVGWWTTPPRPDSHNREDADTGADQETDNYRYEEEVADAT